MNIEQKAILPAGFKTAGVHGGVKTGGKKDVALFVSESPCSAAGVFTTNKVCAAPVKVSREHLAAGRVQAIVVNAGNANACTGAPGLEDAREMTALAAGATGLEPEQVLVCSTGGIGKPLPMDAVRKGIAAAADNLSSEHGTDAAQAILTTDLVTKGGTITVDIGGASARITGIVKGSGMIEPNMATMLAFLMTDAAIPAVALQEMLSEAVDQSFNRISVDGDQSTNDTVLMLANGQHGSGAFDRPAFQAALNALCLDLAKQIVRDGEGATHLITLELEGATNDAQADRAVRAVANSFLVKTAWTGTYPAWGRILSTLGSCGIDLEPDRVDIDYDQTAIVRNGRVTDTPNAEVLAVTGLPAYTIHLRLGGGSGRALLYTCDCSEEYVRINME